MQMALNYLEKNFNLTFRKREMYIKSTVKCQLLLTIGKIKMI